MTTGWFQPDDAQRLSVDTLLFWLQAPLPPRVRYTARRLRPGSTDGQPFVISLFVVEVVVCERDVPYLRVGIERDPIMAVYGWTEMDAKPYRVCVRVEVGHGDVPYTAWEITRESGYKMDLPSEIRRFRKAPRDPSPGAKRFYRGPQEP